MLKGQRKGDAASVLAACIKRRGATTRSSVATGLALDCQVLGASEREKSCSEPSAKSIWTVRTPLECLNIFSETHYLHLVFTYT